MISIYPKAQSPVKRVNHEELLKMVHKNQLYNINALQLKKIQAEQQAVSAVPKTGFFAENEDFQPEHTSGILKLGVSQSLSWPGLYKAQKNYYRQQVKYYQFANAVTDAGLKRDLNKTYYQLWFLQNKQLLYLKLDSIYTSLRAAAILKVKTGDSPGLDSISANVRLYELQALLKQLSKDMLIQQEALRQLLNTDETLLPVAQPLEKLSFNAGADTGMHPVLAQQSLQINKAEAYIAVTKNENKPEFSGRFFSQKLWGAKNPYSGFSISAAFPLFTGKAYQNKVKAANAELALQQQQFDYNAQVFSTQKKQLKLEVEKNLSLLAFYENAGLNQAEEIIKAASLAYRAGEISFADLSQFITQAIEIQKNYLESLNTYNQSVIQYNFYSQP